MNEGRNKNTEQKGRQRMTDQIKNNEAPAGPAYIVDQPDDILIRQVMRHSHCDRYIRRRQRIADCVKLQDWNSSYRRRMQINSDAFYAQFAADLIEDRAMAASDIENSAYGQRISPETIHNRGYVSEPMVSPGKLLVALFPDLCWNGIGIVQDFGDSRPRPHYGRGSVKVVRFMGCGGRSANPNI